MRKRLRYYLRGLGIGIVVTSLILSISGIAGGNGKTLTDDEIKAKAAELGMVDQGSYSLADIAATGEKNETINEDETEASGAAQVKDAESKSDTSEYSEPIDTESKNEVDESIANADNESKTDEEASESKDSVGDDSENQSNISSEEKDSNTDNSTKNDRLSDNENEVKDPDTAESPETAEHTDTAESTETAENPEVAETSETTQNSEESDNSEEAENTDQKVTIVVNSGYGSDRIARLCQEAGLVENAAEFDTYLVKNGYSTSLRVGSFSIKIGATYEEIAKILTGVLQ